jgi:hypothetical protein
MDSGRSWLGVLTLGLVTSVVVLIWYSELGSTNDGDSLDPGSTQQEQLEAASPSRVFDSASFVDGRTVLETRAAGRVAGRLDEAEGLPEDLDHRLETEADYLALFEAVVRRDPDRFDALLAERVGDEALPAVERLAIARVAWQARRPGWKSAYHAGLATSGSDDVRFSRAVQNWLSRDAAAHPEVREFLRASLWGPSRDVATSRCRRALASSLASAATDAEWVSLEAQLHAEPDTAVVLSALIGRGRGQSSRGADRLFERFGLEPPLDLHATEGD